MLQTIRRLLLSSAVATTIILGGCATGSKDAAPEAIGSAPSSRTNLDNIQIVDCLLPGRVRKLGQAMTYLEPRRLVQTSAIECEVRGGTYRS